MKVKLLSLNAKVPVRETEGSAGYDLFAAETVIIENGLRNLVKTDVAMEIPKGYYGRIAPRSSCATAGLDVGAGVIDQDYRGNIKILLINGSGSFYTVTRGTAIAQIIFEKITTPDIEIVDELSTTERGCGGFGSTSKKGTSKESVSFGGTSEKRKGLLWSSPDEN